MMPASPWPTVTCTSNELEGCADSKLQCEKQAGSDRKEKGSLNGDAQPERPRRDRFLIKCFHRSAPCELGDTKPAGKLQTLVSTKVKSHQPQPQSARSHRLHCCSRSETDRAVGVLMFGSKASTHEIEEGEKRNIVQILATDSWTPNASVVGEQAKGFTMRGCNFWQSHHRTFLT